MATGPPLSRSARKDEPETALAASPKEDSASKRLADRPSLPPRADKLDRRREVRFATDQAAALTQIKPITFGITPVRVGNVSMHGLKIYLPQLLYPGATVHVRLTRMVVVAKVLYCLQFGAGHAADMAVLDILPYDGPSALYDAISSWTVPNVS